MAQNLIGPESLLPTFNLQKSHTKFHRDRFFCWGFGWNVGPRSICWFAVLTTWPRFTRQWEGTKWAPYDRCKWSVKWGPENKWAVLIRCFFCGVYHHPEKWIQWWPPITGRGPLLKGIQIGRSFLGWKIVQNTDIYNNKKVLRWLVA